MLKEEWPEVVIVLLTCAGPPERDISEIRFGYTVNTIEHLKKNLHYPNLSWHIADDGSPKEYQDRVLALLKGEKCTFSDTGTGWDLNGNCNLGMKAGFERTDIILLWTDDRTLVYRLDLKPHVKLLTNHKGVAVIRFVPQGEGQTGHKFDHSGKGWWMVDKKSQTSWNAIILPCLFHKRFVEVYGYFQPGVWPLQKAWDIGDRHFKLTEGPGLVVPDDFWKRTEMPWGAVSTWEHPHNSGQPYRKEAPPRKKAVAKSYNVQADYVVVGSGLTGATIARTLKDAGRQVIVIERRPHLGGNLFDYTHPSGIPIHKYGPHYFFTDSDETWAFVNRFASFYKHETVSKSLVNGRHENWPVAANYIRETVGEDWKPGFEGMPSNYEEAALSKVPRVIYDKFIKGYTEKQWGVPATTLSVNLAKRFSVRKEDDPRLRQHKHQGLPKGGYTAFVRNMLDGIPVILNCDYLQCRDAIKVRELLVFTGSIDEYFSFDLGRLAYRGQQRKHNYVRDVDYALPCGQVNIPDPSDECLRIQEWKHTMPEQYVDCIKGTVLTKETPFSPTDPDDYEYPFPDETNVNLHTRYVERAKKAPKLLVCGRLGEYKYYNMDRAIERALELAQDILRRE